MYGIRLADGSPIFIQGDPDYTAFDIECCTQKGDSGYLKFTIPKDSPAWGTLVTRKSLLEFTCGNESLGFYEVRELDHSIEFEERVYAVGELAWLFDSIQPQAEFHDISPRDFLRTLLTVHNAQCPDHTFRLGAVDVTDPNDSLYRYTNRETTLDDIRDKLVNRLGGQIRLRRSNGERYIDYLTDATYGAESTQRIEFGENLLDYSDTMTVDDICSSVIPLGYRLQNDATNTQIGNLENRLTIESVNGGLDYITDSTLVQRFGNVRTTRVWDDVTIPANLLSKARAWLQSDQYERMHLSVRAIDLSLTSDEFAKLRMGDLVTVVAEPYGLYRRFPITKRTFHPESPESDSIELGDDVRVSYVASQNAQNKSTTVQLAETDYRQTQWLTGAIDNVTAMMTGSRGGYKYTEYDEQGRWLADYYMDSPDKELAQVVHKVNLNGDAYSTNGVDGPYETAIMANGTILGKYIQAGSVTAEQISQDYTSQWEDADAQTLNTTRTEFAAADAQIAARVTQVEQTAAGLRTDLAAEIKVRADQIATTVKRGEINSTISQTAETIYIKSNKFGWESTNSTLSTNGTLTTNNMTATNINATGKLASEASSMRTVVEGGKITFSSKQNNTWKTSAIIDSSLSGNYATWRVHTPNSESMIQIHQDTAGMFIANGAVSLAMYKSGSTLALKASTLTINGTQAYTGSVYLTYGNGGKIYLTVKNGLICGWTV